MKKSGGFIVSKSTTLRLTNKEYWMVQKHKALLECDDWEMYLKVLLIYPRQRRELIYLSHETDQRRAITMRMSDETFKEVNDRRRRFFKPWREFVLESAFEDGTPEACDWFKANSKIHLNLRGAPK